MDTNQNPISLSTSWVETLALDELNREETGVVDLHDHLNPLHRLEESSIDFMNFLRDRFELYTAKFNEFRGKQVNAHIKIFKISNTVNDFMLFRHSLRLIFTRKAHDVISIGLSSNGKDLYSARLDTEEPMGQNPLHEIRAHLGAFGKITWRFQGEEVDIDTLVRHYMSEFVKQSSR